MKWLRRAMGAAIALALMYVLARVYSRYGRVVNEPLGCMFVPENDWRRDEYLCHGQVVMVPFLLLILALGILTFWAVLKVLPLWGIKRESQPRCSSTTRER